MVWAAKYINLADTSDKATPQDKYQKGWCGNCLESKQLREMLLGFFVAGFHGLYAFFSILWLLSYTEISGDAAYKTEYTGIFPMADMERHLFTHCILTGAVTLVGALCLLHPVNELMHGWFLYGAFKGVRFATVSLTIILYVMDLIFWDQIGLYGNSGSFYQDRTPQLLTLISMAGYVGVTHLTDQMNVMYLQNTYGSVGEPTDKEQRSRFYGKYRV